MSDPTSHNLPELTGRYSELIAVQALPAAGAWLTGEMAVPDKDNLTLYYTYDEAAAGAAGSLQTMIEFSPFSATPGAGVEWYRDQAFAVGTVTLGAETTSLLAPEVIQFTPLGATREGFFLQVALNRNVERVRVSVREAGQVGAPGTCQVVAISG